MWSKAGESKALWRRGGQPSLARVSLGTLPQVSRQLFFGLVKARRHRQARSRPLQPDPRGVARIRRDANARAADLCPAGSWGEGTKERTRLVSCISIGVARGLLHSATEVGLLEQSQRGKSGHENPVEVHVCQAVCRLTGPGRCCWAGFSPPGSAHVPAPADAAASPVPALQEELALHKL